MIFLHFQYLHPNLVHITLYSENTAMSIFQKNRPSMIFKIKLNPSGKIIQIYCFREMIGELTTDDPKLLLSVTRI